MQTKNELATFGGGCFWCLEAIYKRIKGVVAVRSGYAGGTTTAPTYDDVCRGVGGHAEVVQIEYDPAVVSYTQLLELFWQGHDPTTLNRQGADVGIQYRSVILYHDDRQRAAAEASRDAAQQPLRRPVVTTIEPLQTFYPAEKYHHDYYDTHPGATYCHSVIRPKLRKMALRE